MTTSIERRPPAATYFAIVTMLLGSIGAANADIDRQSNHDFSSEFDNVGTVLIGIERDGNLILGTSNISHLRRISASGLRGISASGLRGISASGLRGISASGLRGISASGLRGISASGLRGISASGLRGISASGLRGISASGLRGISASGLRGISASGLRGISASGLRGISGSGLRGISGSGLRGISASGLRGISASGLRGISASGLRGISASGLRSDSEGAVPPLVAFEPIPLIAVGVVSETSAGSSVATVIGQQIVIDDQTLLVTVGSNHSSPSVAIGSDIFDQLSEGDYVAIAGEVMDPGYNLATVVVKLEQPYVDGASPAYLRSMLTSTDTSLALASSGNTRIDYSGALNNKSLSGIHPRAVVEYIGFTAAASPNWLIAMETELLNQ